MFSNSFIQTDSNESKKKDEKNAKKILQRLGEPNRGSNLRQQSNLSFFKPKASPCSKTHKPNSSSCKVDGIKSNNNVPNKMIFHLRM
jgi:hypothetical protein